MPIYADYPEAEYHAHPAACKSKLWTLHTRTPWHCKNALPESNKRMDLGSAAHMALLEPERFETDCIKGPVDRRGNKWKDVSEYAKAYSKLAVTSGEYEAALYMRDAALKVMDIRRLLIAPPLTEHSAFWEDDETGEECRGRVDIAQPALGWLADCKFVEDANKEKFEKNAGNMGYHLQDAMYSHGWHKAGGFKVERFIFIAIETTYPHASQVFEYDELAKAEGRMVMNEALTKYGFCRKADTWPGYPSDIQTITLKPWQRTFF